jgi:hypothetical protein
MFKAFVLMCAIADPSNCYEFSDNRGPYSTRDACIDRVGEMIGAIHSMPNNTEPQSYKYKCVKIGTET